MFSLTVVVVAVVESNAGDSGHSYDVAASIAQIDFVKQVDK